MATSVFPAVMDALVTLSTAALPSVTVTDGPDVSGNPGDFLMIGVDDPDAESPTTAADIQQSRLAMGGSRREDGTITCCAYSWVGDTGAAAQKAVRDAAFATKAAVETILRTTSPTLGVAEVLKTEFGERVTVSQAQTPRGADCLVTFTVAYMAQL